MTIPARHCGIGLRQPHYRDLLTCRPALDFVEVHSENFFHPEDASMRILDAVRDDYPVSLHGVGLSLGSACGLDEQHLDSLARLVERIDPVRVSDHACFARAALAPNGLVHANDLLPIAFTRASRDILCANIDQAQHRIKRTLLIENLSSYLSFADSDFSEAGFLVDVAQRSGCGLLLDINNLMVNALNADAPDPLRAVCDWLDELARLAPAGLVGEIHLAGFSAQNGLIIDDHSAPVSAQVWQAYAYAMGQFGPVPTLIEWDENLPDFAVLCNEAAKAARLADTELADHASAEYSLTERSA